jgi:dephospho-CoA kinase
MRLLILTGASGSGKTAIAKAVEAIDPPVARVRHFDSVGVPSAEEMISLCGSIENWQRAMTHEWLKRLCTESASEGQPILFEGQMRLQFIFEALQANRIIDACVLLVDCDDEVRSHRLAMNRRQADLATPTMMQWARYLREEAKQRGVKILDTSGAERTASVAKVLEELSAQRHLGT